MSLKVPITSISRTLNIYGQSTYPRKILGTFSCDVQGRNFSGLEITKGHVNSLLRRIRVLSIINSTDHWDFDTTVEQVLGSELIFVGDDKSISFFPERVSAKVKTQGIIPDDCERLRGHAKLEINGCEHIEVYEPDTITNRYIYLMGNSEVLKRLYQYFELNGVCELIMIDTEHGQ